jgi:hypothetical protein
VYQKHDKEIRQKLYEKFFGDNKKHTIQKREGGGFLGLATMNDLNMRMSHMQDKLSLMQDANEKDIGYLKSKLETFGFALTEVEENYELFQNATCSNFEKLEISLVKESMQRAIFNKLQQINNVRESCRNGRIPNQIGDEELILVCQKYLEPSLCLKIGPRKIRAISTCRSGHLFLTLDSILYEIFLVFPTLIESKVYNVESIPIQIDGEQMILDDLESEIFIESENGNYLAKHCDQRNDISLCHPSTLYDSKFNCLEEIVTNTTINACQFTKINSQECFMKTIQERDSRICI